MPVFSKFRCCSVFSNQQWPEWVTVAFAFSVTSSLSLHSFCIVCNCNVLKCMAECSPYFLMRVVQEHSCQCVTLTWHFDTSSDATDWIFNTVAGARDYGRQTYCTSSLRGSWSKIYWCYVGKNVQCVYTYAIGLSTALRVWTRSVWVDASGVCPSRWICRTIFGKLNKIS
jgi:hypothetical protein